MNTHRRSYGLFILVLLVLTVFPAEIPLYAQSGDSVAVMNQKANELIKELKYTEALPLLEKLVVAEPGDSGHQFYLGFGLLGQASNVSNTEERKALRVRARNAFVKAKDMGSREGLLDALIQALPADGAMRGSFSADPGADALMNAAEGFFSQGKLEEAVTLYQKALDLDPKIYEAALFTGDVYTQRSNYELAETWYQKAIAIDPTRETAYRYSATPFMRQGKTSQARDRYIEAYVTEPYSKFAIAGMQQWGDATKTLLGHPEIEIPEVVSFDSDGNAKTDLDPAMASRIDDGSFAWVAYGTKRSQWKKESFAKAFPAEKTYRHSLPEEAEALRAVLASAKDPRVQTLNPSLARLKKLDSDGFLEAYILTVQMDEGIAKDFPSYLEKNREKLRQYVVKYVLTGGDN